MNGASTADAAHVVSEAQTRVVQLPCASLASKLSHYLEELADTRRAYGMAPGFEAAASVHWNPTCERCGAGAQHRWSIAWRTQSDVLHGHYLRDREAVVHLGEVKIVGRNAGLIVGGAGGLRGGRERRKASALGE